MGHPNEDLVRQGYEAFGKGDMDTIRGLFADDIVWHTPGKKSPLAGDYKGMDEVLGLFMKTVEMSGGTFKIELHDVMANDEHAVALAKVSGRRDGKTLSDNQVHVFHVKDGKVTEFWGHPWDLYQVDEFWS